MPAGIGIITNDARSSRGKIVDSPEIREAKRESRRRRNHSRSIRRGRNARKIRIVQSRESAKHTLSMMLRQERIIDGMAKRMDDAIAHLSSRETAKRYNGR